jgi:glycosyltransferase involved in cell wall biosynthesis
MTFIHLNYHCHTEFDRPEPVIRLHQFSSGFIDLIKHQVHFISVKHMKVVGFKRSEEVDYHFFRRRNKFRAIPFTAHRFIKNQAPDVVLTEGFVFPLQLLFLRWKLGRKCVLIAQHHGEKPFTGLKGIFQKMADRVIDGYVFTSSGNARPWLDKKIIRKESKCFEVLSASSNLEQKDKEDCKRRLGLARHSNFLWVGRLITVKDPLTVVKAFAGYTKLNAEARLYMIFQADDLLREVKELITSTGIGSSVILVGEKSHQEMADWYSAADFFISGSHREGSGYALVEAMRCGCLPVVTQIPSFQKITGNGSYGLLFKPGDADELLSRLLELEALPQKNWSARIVSYAQQELSFEAISNQLLDVCRRLAK